MSPIAVIAAEEMWSDGIEPHGLPGMSSSSLGIGRCSSSQTTRRATRCTSPSMRPPCSDAHHGGAVGKNQ
jgi:hypothetical protein